MPTRTHHYAQVSLLWLLLISSEAYHPDLGDMLLISYIDQCFVCDSQIFFTTAFCTKQYINSATFRRKNSPLNGYFSCLNHLTPMQRHFIRLGTESWSGCSEIFAQKSWQVLNVGLHVKAKSPVVQPMPSLLFSIMHPSSLPLYIISQKTFNCQSKYIKELILISLVADIGPKIQYFLLCDSLPEDRWLREDLQRKKLVSI